MCIFAQLTENKCFRRNFWLNIFLTTREHFFWIVKLIPALLNVYRIAAIKVIYILRDNSKALRQENQCAEFWKYVRKKGRYSHAPSHDLQRPIPSVSDLTLQSERLRLLKTILRTISRFTYSSIRLSLNSSCFLHTLSLHNAIWKISISSF